ncbi:MAG TPA: OmpA family protein [Candidatus Hydrogenedentes bacterium]|nr:OmpA family protein [Candidatus Hydrogenedentota bacterium]HRK33724.1 OmpA family protein [Candidatus Hydrogenedentota bacterium]
MFHFVRIAIVAAAIAVAPSAWAAACCAKGEGNSCCAKSHAHAACEGGSCSMHAKSSCCAATQFKDPADVHWVHKGVSFGNYMKMAKAELPAHPPVAPSFGPIYFDFDKSHLRPESVEVCRQLVAYLQANPGAKVTIEGNCCDIGTVNYNKKLGERRAKSVKKFLIENGIDAKRITTISHGEEKPKHSERPLNRRDDFIVQCAEPGK